MVPYIRGMASWHVKTGIPYMYYRRKAYKKSRWKRKEQRALKKFAEELLKSMRSEGHVW